MLLMFSLVYVHHKIAPGMARAYVLGLEDLPARIFRPVGISLMAASKWFPSVAEVRDAALIRLAAERVARGKEARAAIAACTSCGGKGWREVGNAVERCDCYRAAVAQTGAPLALPAHAATSENQE